MDRGAHGTVKNEGPRFKSLKERAMHAARIGCARGSFNRSSG
jgi:hypothetical protein